MNKILFTNCITIASVLIISSCGTNTDKPAFPLYSIISPVSTPALTNVTAILSATDDNPTRYEFDISYFVTNREDEFIGYNLYISSSAIASNNNLVGVSGAPYLETGIAPSFSHTNSEASTLAADLKTERIEYSKPAPSPISFQYCEFYYFRLVAVVYNGIESNTSPQIQSCAAEDSGLCPSGTPCNP